jgi:hypothetical protein
VMSGSERQCLAVMSGREGMVPDSDGRAGQHPTATVGPPSHFPLKC